MQRPFPSDAPPAATPAVDTTVPNRLQLASRINHLMLRELGQGIEIERLLSQDRYARDVLLVCDALRASELAVLAAEFRAASRVVMGPLAPPGHVVQATDWAADTSGFGALAQVPPDEAALPAGGSQPGAAGSGPVTERRRGWLNWRRR